MIPPPHVGLVDDDPALRRALTRLLSAGGFSVRSFPSAADLLNSLDHTDPPPPDCLVLDVQMPDTGGLDLLDLLNASGRDIPVIFLTGHGTIPLTVRAMKNGALNVLTKPVNDTDLFAAVHAALATAATRKAHHSRTADARKRLASLTPREREVMTHLITGKLNKQTAAHLHTCEQTIKVHRMRILRKLNIRSIAELTRLAADLNIHPAPHTT
jgi:FixJ family two-component response regulator